MARRRRRDRSGSTTNHSRFRGWVYVMDNEAMPEVVKVGYTLDDPVNRAWELRSTGNPYAYVVQYHALVDNPRGLERAVHEKLRQFRGEGEWFAVSLMQAISAIRESGVRLLFQDDSPRWHPSQPTPSEASRTKLQREKDKLERDRLEREAAAQAKRDLERAEQHRRESTASSKGRDFELTVMITRAKATAGCVTNVLSAHGQHLKVTCPPGIKDGSKLRLREQGYMSRQGGPPGDMFVLVAVRN
jgi:T5orf172 domain/DnaJ C terminal domain